MLIFLKLAFNFVMEGQTINKQFLFSPLNQILKARTVELPGLIYQSLHFPLNESRYGLKAVVVMQIRSFLLLLNLFQPVLGQFIETF